MPNGGSDCCANCRYNRVRQEIEQPASIAEATRFAEKSFCTLRGVRITNPFWTYCRNFQSGPPVEPAEEQPVPHGWVYAAGMEHEYSRIPWHGNSEPKTRAACVCAVCGRSVLRGITVTSGEAALGFCSDRHYVEWWKTQHDDAGIELERFKSPPLA